MTTTYFRSASKSISKKATSSLLILSLVAFLFAVSVNAEDNSAHASGHTSPIMGPSQLTAAQIVQWYKSKKGNQWPLTALTLTQMANLYVNEGNLIGVRGDVAFAQAIHETGWFGSACSRLKNNYSGWGARNPTQCSTLAYADGGGYHFTNANGLTGPQRSVRVQMHQLRNYADATSVNTWNPRPEFSRDGFVYKGNAKNWVDLNGKWAVPGTTYAQAIFGTYNQMLAYHGLSGFCTDAPPENAQTSGNGYWTVAANGAVKSYGNATNYGSMAGARLNASVLGMAPTGTGRGYWLVAADGGIFSFGDAQFYGSTGSMRLNKPIVGMASTPSGRGYWLVASDGGIFTFGDAQFYGSTGSYRLNKPIVGMAPTVNGRGYWLVASDGGIFAFGNAQFYGSTGAQRLNEPIVGMVARPQGNGYWLLARDGGVFAFGQAPFRGSLGACSGRVANSIQANPSGNGYYISETNGRVVAFGNSRHFGYNNLSSGVGMAAKK